MSIERRIYPDGKPRYFVRIEDRNPATGERTRIAVGTYRTKKEAEAAESKALTERDGGTLLKADKTTVAELLDRWLADKAASVTSNTLADYRGVIETHIKPALGRMPIRALTPADIQDQYMAWSKAGLSPRMIRGAHLRLSQAFDHAVRLKMILHNPVKDATPPKLPRTPFDHWDQEEARRFLDTAQTDTYAPLWSMLLREGMRRGEALGLRWRDINWETRTAHLVQTVVVDKAGRSGPMIQPRTKTKAGARTVELTTKTLAELRALKDRRAFGDNEAIKPTPDGLIFCTRDGRVLNPNNVIRNFNAIVERAGVRRIKLHELRHTNATLLLLAGQPAKVVSERLGHASVAITLDTYSHVLPSMQAEAAASLDRMLG
jgi:integrase